MYRDILEPHAFHVSEGEAAQVYTDADTMKAAQDEHLNIRARHFDNILTFGMGYGRKWCRVGACNHAAMNIKCFNIARIV